MGTKRGVAKAAHRKRRRRLNSISLSSIICFYNGVSEGYLLSTVCTSVLRLILAAADKSDNKIIGNFFYENGKLQCDPK
jgi:hypothetical protein